VSKEARDTAWEKSCHDGTTLLVLLALAEYANETGHAWPSATTLAARVRLNERQVGTHLNRLIASGDIVIAESYGRGKSTTYRIALIDADWKPAATRAEAMKKAQSSAGFYKSDKPKKAQSSALPEGEKAQYSTPLSQEKAQSSAGYSPIKGAEFCTKKAQSSAPQSVPPPPVPLPPYGGEAYASPPGTVDTGTVPSYDGSPSASATAVAEGASSSLQNADGEGMSETSVASPVREPASAIGFFLAVGKRVNGKSPFLPNKGGAGMMAKRLEDEFGQDVFRAAVEYFFADEWYRANYGASWGKFFSNFETIRAQSAAAAVVPTQRGSPSLTSAPRPIAPRMQGRENPSDINARMTMKAAQHGMLDLSKSNGNGNGNGNRP
jgi:hypothetical protein